MTTTTPKSGPASLDEADIRSERNPSRRSVLGRLGLGAGAAAALLVASPTVARAQSDEEERGRGCPLRDLDNNDTARRRCGQTDND